MNNNFPELMSELNRERIIDEMKAIRLENEVNIDSNWLSHILLLIGDWLIASGEMLHRQTASSAPDTNQVQLLNSVALKLEHKK